MWAYWITNKRRNPIFANIAIAAISEQKIACGLTICHISFLSSFVIIALLICLHLQIYKILRSSWDKKKGWR